MPHVDALCGTPLGDPLWEPFVGPLCGEPLWEPLQRRCSKSPQKKPVPKGTGFFKPKTNQNPRSEAILRRNRSHIGRQVQAILLRIVMIEVDAQAPVLREVVTDARTGIPAGLVEVTAGDVVIARAVALPAIDAGAAADVPLRIDVEVAVHTRGPAVQFRLATVDHAVAVEEVLGVDVTEVVVTGLDTDGGPRGNGPAITAVEGITRVMAVVTVLVDRGAADVAVDEPAGAIGVLRESGSRGHAGGNQGEGDEGLLHGGSLLLLLFLFAVPGQRGMPGSRRRMSGVALRRTLDRGYVGRFNTA